MPDGWNTIVGLVGIILDKWVVSGYTMDMLNDFGVAK